MKNSKVLLSVLLVILMLLSCIPSALAADAQTSVRQYGKEGGYIAFGDSIARGVGATGDNDAETHDFYDRTVDGSYPYLVAQAVGCNIKDDARDPDSNFWPVCFHGQTLALTMDLLGIEDGYYDDEYAHGSAKDSFRYYDTMVELYGDAAEKLKQASLITLGFGFSDIFYRAIVVAQIRNPEFNAAFIPDILAGLKEGYSYFVKTYPLLLSYIKENNPDATVVIVGNYSVAGDTPLSNDIMLRVGIPIQSVLNNFNTMLVKWAKEYGYLYCDIGNAETLASQEDIGLLSGFMDNAGLAGHLSSEGNAMIARDILKLLPTTEGSTQEKTKDITVDLGRFTAVSRVKLDGVILDEDSYAVDGYELTVKNCRIAAKSLVVVAENEKGQTSRYNYCLSYKNGRYQAKLKYGINDATGMLINKLEEFIMRVMSFFIKK